MANTETLKHLKKCSNKTFYVKLSFFVTSDMYTQSGLITELMDKAPPKFLKITYAGNNILDQNTGKENTPTQAR